MTDTEKREASRQFYQKCAGKGNEGLSALLAREQRTSEHRRHT